LWLRGAGLERIDGQQIRRRPLKNIAIGLNDDVPRLGECVITATGIEGSLIYALSAPIREAINRHGSATVHIDLLPGRPVDKVQSALASRAARARWPSTCTVSWASMG
jgi:predicted flavoprotein YhiN